MKERYQVEAIEMPDWLDKEDAIDRMNDLRGVCFDGGEPHYFDTLEEAQRQIDAWIEIDQEEANEDEDEVTFYGVRDNQTDTIIEDTIRYTGQQRYYCPDCDTRTDDELTASELCCKQKRRFESAIAALQCDMISIAKAAKSRGIEDHFHSFVSMTGSTIWVSATEFFGNKQTSIFSETILLDDDPYTYNMANKINLLGIRLMDKMRDYFNQVDAGERDI